MQSTVAQAVAAAFQAAGIGGPYGRPFGAMAVLGAPDGLAELLALAHATVYLQPAVTHAGGGRFVVGASPDGARGESLVVRAPSDLQAAARRLEEIVFADPQAVVELRVELDPDDPAPGVPAGRQPVDVDLPAPSPEATSALEHAENPVVLAGPGVLRDGVSGLHALAGAGDLGVLNTWGAKGVFHWRSRHHWATVGLQARDLQLCGLWDSDLVVMTGLDPSETPPEVATLPNALAVAPGALGALAEQCGQTRRELAMPPLRARLAAVTEEGWRQTARPLAPSAVTRNYAWCTTGRGFVAADPGTAGFWIARTLPTTRVGEARVPGRPRTEGFGVACALVARMARFERPGARVLAVADAPLCERSAELLELAGSWEVPLAVELWDPDGPSLSAEAHLDRVLAMAGSTRTSVTSVATDPTQLARIEAVAGPVVAWRERRSGNNAVFS